MEDTTLRSLLDDWTDWDLAGFALAQSLGLMPSDITLFQTRAKHVFWGGSPVGSVLFDTLRALVTVGVLEYREEPDDQYRWNMEFQGSWEEPRPDKLQFL